MRVSEYFELVGHQGSFDFVDVPIDSDAKLFIDPSTLVGRTDEWAQACVSSIQTYFQAVLDAIMDGDEKAAKALLSHLHEDNSTHLGYSSNSRGQGVGTSLADAFYDELRQSEAVQSGQIRDLEETALLVRGVDRDRISDVVTNIIRQQLVEYTQGVCVFYGIDVEPNAGEGWTWDSRTSKWEYIRFDAPVAAGDFLTLVPKSIVRRTLYANSLDFYSRQILPYRYNKEEVARSPLTRTLRDGTIQAKKVEAQQAYRDEAISLHGRKAWVKASNYKNVQESPDLLRRYMDAKRATPAALESERVLAAVLNTDAPDLAALVADLEETEPGKDDANKYERAVEALMTGLLYPALVYPVRQSRIHDGRKIVDITYVNAAGEGTFHWIGNHHPSATIAVECKNYTPPPANPELDQLAGRFSPRRGQVGILVCRTLGAKKAILKSCRDTADDHRGFIIALDHNDLAALVNEYYDNDRDATTIGGLLYERFRALID